jgi:endogenous inhibitor of DNA gyrase (YacG/DUF329 family)
MALINCPECGTAVSEKAETCLKSGCRIIQNLFHAMKLKNWLLERFRLLTTIANS